MRTSGTARSTEECICPPSYKTVTYKTVTYKTVTHKTVNGRCWHWLQGESPSPIPLSLGSGCWRRHTGARRSSTTPTRTLPTPRPTKPGKPYPSPEVEQGESKIVLPVRRSSGVWVYSRGIWRPLAPPHQPDPPDTYRRRANMAHIRQSSPDLGLGLKVLNTFSVVPPYLSEADVGEGMQARVSPAPPR